MANTTETLSTATSAVEGVAETTTHAADAAGHAAESAGMPQLDFSTFPNQIFWLLVALVVIYLILSKIALPRIGGILADRQGRITGDIEAAEKLKSRAIEAEKAYNQALIDARNEANRIVGETRAEIQKDLDAATAKADAEISARTAESSKRIDEIRVNAVASVTEVAKDTAEAIVSALGGSADSKSVADAVAARLKG
ncbi:MAG: F0F1 ATP synthase subunit B' [Paracoccaceae bacterium]|jgi:F-type H+-transporting ATPase subunit b